MSAASLGRPAIRILVVDDHTLFRRGLTALLARDPRLQVVGDAADVGEALRRIGEALPDVILLDNHLPGVRGIDALPALRDAAPQARILMLTVSEDEADLAAALRSGAAGYLLKNHRGRRADRRDRPCRARRQHRRAGNDEQAGRRVSRRTEYNGPRRRPRRRQRRRSLACRRANSTCCAASFAAPAIRKSRANTASPKRPSRSTSSTCCASST